MSPKKKIKSHKEITQIVSLENLTGTSPKKSNKIPNDRNRHELTRKDLQNTHKEILRKTHLSLPQSYHRESPGKHSQKNLTVIPRIVTRVFSQ